MTFACNDTSVPSRFAPSLTVITDCGAGLPARRSSERVSARRTGLREAKAAAAARGSTRPNLPPNAPPIGTDSTRTCRSGTLSASDTSERTANIPCELGQIVSWCPDRLGSTMIDGGNAILGGRLRLRQHDSNGMTAPQRLFLRKWRLGTRTSVPLRHAERLAGVYGLYARNGLCRGSINAQDARMRVRAQYQPRVQHACYRNVAGIASAPGQFIGSILPARRSADRVMLCRPVKCLGHVEKQLLLTICIILPTWSHPAHIYLYIT